MRYALLVFAVVVAAESFADINVRIAADTNELVYVAVSTHHADLHNGYSRTRFRGALAANTDHKIDTGFYINLSHYSAMAYHPDFILASARTPSRFGGLPTLALTAWHHILDNLEALPMTGHGPTLARAAEHIRLFNELYLVELDRAGVPPRSTQLDELETFWLTAQSLVPMEPRQTQASTWLRLRRDGQKALDTAQTLLGLSSKNREAIYAFRELTLGPKPMRAYFLETADQQSLAAYVENWSSAPRSAKPPEPLHWSVDDVQFQFSLGSRFVVQQGDKKIPCYRGFVTFDATHLAGGALADLQKSLNADFCAYARGWALKP